MLTNIITNAVKGDGVEFSVEDFGISIPAELKEKIFERHFRVSDPTVGTISGGIRAISRAGIVRQHGGTMSVVSEEGKGSTFSFTIPYHGLDRRTTHEADNNS